MRCEPCDVEITDLEHVLEHILFHQIQTERLIMTQASNEQHLTDDVAAIGANVATIITELKAQVAAGEPLDFAAADALVASTQAEATADAPAAPPVATPAAPADGTSTNASTDPTATADTPTTADTQAASDPTVNSPTVAGS